MGADAAIYVRSLVGPFARGSLQPPFIGRHAALAGRPLIGQLWLAGLRLTGWQHQQQRLAI